MDSIVSAFVEGMRRGAATVGGFPRSMYRARHEAGAHRPPCLPRPCGDRLPLALTPGSSRLDAEQSVVSTVLKTSCEFDQADSEAQTKNCLENCTLFARRA